VSVRVFPLRVAGAAIGLAVMTCGVVAMFATDKEAGSASLLGLGALVLGVAVFSDRVESVEFGAAKLRLRDLARQRFALAAEREKQGDSETATRLRKQARALQRLAGTYGQIRGSMPGGPERTHVLDDLMQQARQLAKSKELDPAEIWTWFDEGADEARVIALGLMEGDERLCDFFCALDAIEHPRSLFEQYYGLRVARKMVSGLSKLELDWLEAAIQHASRARRFRNDASLPAAAKCVLAAVEEARKRRTA
jgi:hypothetical protein